MSGSPELFLNLLATASLAEAEEGGRLLRQVGRHEPAWLPRLIGDVEPLEDRFEPERLSELWRGRKIWWQARGRTSGTVYPRVRRRVHSSFALDISSSDPAADGERAAALLRDAAREFGGEWGYVHLLTEEEARSAAPESVQAHAEGRLLTWAAHRLRDYLPDVYWANIFGTPYISLFGREALESAPAAAVEEVARGLFYVQLTARADDVRERPAEFAEARAALKRHLGEAAFWSAERGDDPEAYEAPRFAEPPISA